ncbi:MAG TPA: NAD-dependent epimerase/dehydratase family protein [Gaiellaceae bacterium]|nr:NAD-dependent epimerase/dehydratase family protein [Gaiellaceae bacterium]
MEERFLVTGALGCIGAWILRILLREGIPAAGFDLGTNTSRLALILEPDELARIELVQGDVTDLAAVERALDDSGATHVVHLAAMLIPLAKADPPRGAHVNVVGTVNVLEAARRRERVRGLSYASSAAVYGPDSPTRVAEDAAPTPATHYGVHKLANEGAARVYWADEGVPSIGLRPYVVYGAGRDQGVTAEPTLAMAAAARGEPYHIGFGGRMQMHYAPDAARAFVEAARRSEEGGALVANLGGPATGIDEVITAIEAAAPEAAGSITFAETPLPFPEEFEGVVHPAQVTPLRDAVAETIALFRERL